MVQRSARAAWDFRPSSRHDSDQFRSAAARLAQTHRQKRRRCRPVVALSRKCAQRNCSSIEKLLSSGAFTRPRSRYRRHFASLRACRRTRCAMARRVRDLLLVLLGRNPCAARLCGLPSAVVHNGYNPDVFQPDEAARSAVRDHLGIDSQTFLIGSVARWHPHKDVPNLLRAVRMAADKGLPLQCLLIGNGLGSDNDELTAAIRSTGCEGLVVPLGVRSDFPDVACALDLHVLSSCSEAFPKSSLKRCSRVRRTSSPTSATRR